MTGWLLTNVPADAAEILSYSMLVVVAIFLLSGPFVVYYYYRKNKRTKSAQPTASA